MTRRIRSIIGIVLLLSGSSLTMAGRTSTSAQNELVLVGGTIYTSPTDDPIEDGVVLIRDGTIAAVGPRGTLRLPEGVETLDCSGLTVAAGFWNNHVHFFQRKWADAANLPASELEIQLRAMLTRYGFTSVYDLGSPWENTRQLRARIESGEVLGPRIRSTGEALLGEGWMPSETVLRVLGFIVFPAPEVTDAASAGAAAKKLLGAGADGLKLFAAAPSPPFAPLARAAIQAAVEEAHRRDKPVFVHPTDREGLLAAVEAGVDVVAHTTPQSGPWDEAVLAAMREAKVDLVPTLKLWRYQLRHDRASLDELWSRTSIGQVRAWLAAGGRVLFGTDAGGMSDYDPSEEYGLMSEAGMTFRQILASLTTAPAERFGESDRLGRIAPGLSADLVVLDGDPSRDVRSLAAVRYTLSEGKLIYASPR